MHGFDKNTVQYSVDMQWEQGGQNSMQGGKRNPCELEMKNYTEEREHRSQDL
jgi:hypothetical protein